MFSKQTPLFIGLVIGFLFCLPGCSGAAERLDVAIDASANGVVVFSGHGSGGNDLYLLDTRTNKVSRLTDTPDDERTPAFSPDGKMVAYTASNDDAKTSHIYVQPVDGGARIQITSGTSTYDMWPRFTQDAKSIIFSRSALRRPYSMGGYTWDDWDIWMVSIDGTNLTRLTEQKYRFTSSPNSCSGDKQVIYSADTGGSNGSSIYTVQMSDPAGTNRKLIAGSEPSCSQNGKQVVFIDDRKTAYEYEVWVMNMDGTEPKQLTSFRSYKTNPLFSQDGTQILFVSDPKGHKQPELWQVDTKGDNLRRLAGSELFSSPMEWKP